MRTNKEVQEWLDNKPIDENDVDSVKTWLRSAYPNVSFSFRSIQYGQLLPDVIEFVNSPSPSKEKDLSPIVAQFAKVKKELSKLEKLINKI